MINISAEEKLLISHSNEVETTGVGTAPRRREYVGKWINTSDVISRYDVVNSGSGDFASDSNSTVIGSNVTTAAAQDVTVTDGAIFYETDTNKEYILYNNTWTEI